LILTSKALRLEEDMKYITLTGQEERVARAIVNAAYIVHKSLGPGLLENIYEICFSYELQKSGFSVRRQQPIKVHYDDRVFDEGFRIDVMVEGLVACELKAVESMNPVYEAQLLTYLKLTGKRLGFLINFNVPLIKDGLKRMILGT
jgi:GxxExxY protein